MCGMTTSGIRGTARHPFTHPEHRHAAAVQHHFPQACSAALRCALLQLIAMTDFYLEGLGGSPQYIRRMTVYSIALQSCGSPLLLSR
jgi:hypothetical protein